MASHRRFPALFLLVLLSAAAQSPLCRADDEADRKECTDVLVVMEPCLPYVTPQGTATNSTPTPECCSALNRVMSNSLRCLCVLIKDKDRPFMKAYNINLDRALTILGGCVANSSLATCPKLLNLAADSPEAKLFKDVDGKLHGNATAGGSTPSTPGSATATSNPSTTSSSGAVNRHYYPGMGGGLMWWLGGGLWVYTSVAALLLVAVLNVHDV